LTVPFLATELTSLLSTVRRPGDFFAAGTIELLAPSLEVEGGRGSKRTVYGLHRKWPEPRQLRDSTFRV